MEISISLSPEGEKRLKHFIGSYGESPSEVVNYALELLEAWEDELDIVAASEAMEEVKLEGIIPWETVKGELGL